MDSNVCRIESLVEMQLGAVFRRFILRPVSQASKLRMQSQNRHARRRWLAAIKLLHCWINGTKPCHTILLNFWRWGKAHKEYNWTWRQWACQSVAVFRFSFILLCQHANPITISIDQIALDLSIWFHFHVLCSLYWSFLSASFSPLV